LNENEYRPVNSDQITVYWDTSFINRYAMDYKWGDARATKGYQMLKNRAFILSPVNMFELLQIKDNIKRETLIVICQNLFYERCFPSPEELILRHLSMNCPTFETKFELVSKNLFSLVWEDIVFNTSKTFVYDIDELRRKKTILYEFFKSMRRFIHQNRNPVFYSLSDHASYKENDIGQILLKHNIKLFEMDRDTAFVYMFILAIVCGGIGIDPEPFKIYWQQMGIRDIGTRFAFLREKHPGCFLYGPAASIGMMASIQAVHSPNAGAMFDCLHIVYLAYSKHFQVCDDGFLKFRDTLPSALRRRISHYDELRISTQTRDVYKGEDQLYL